MNSSEIRTTAEPCRAVLSVRIRADLKARLEKPRLGPYRISITEAVERGIELALAELETLTNG